MMALTRGATVDATHFGLGHPINSLGRECAARHAPIVDEWQENDNIYMSEEVIVTDSDVSPASYLQVSQMLITSRITGRNLNMCLVNWRSLDGIAQ